MKSLLLLLTMVMTQSTGGRWIHFDSLQNLYSVEYPASWHFLQEISPDLDILSFPPSERIEGVVIKKNGAEITVSKGGPEFPSVKAWLRHDLRNERLIESHVLPIREPKVTGCQELLKATWRTDASGAGKAFIFNTVFYCSTKVGPFSVGLINWDGDSQQVNFQKIALRIALSLRTH